jgi:hypothetical protein
MKPDTFVILRIALSPGAVFVLVSGVVLDKQSHSFLKYGS